MPHTATPAPIPIGEMTGKHVDTAHQNIVSSNKAYTVPLLKISRALLVQKREDEIIKLLAQLRSVIWRLVDPGL